jgi:4-hydroxy-L-threonine phosphate dehydrogenase PdxA
MSVSGSIPLALTIGEAAGIGPDLALTVWRRRREFELPAFYLIGEPNFLRFQFVRSICRSPPRPASPMPTARQQRSRRSAARSRT